MAHAFQPLWNLNTNRRSPTACCGLSWLSLTLGKAHAHFQTRILLLTPRGIVPMHRATLDISSRTSGPCGSFGRCGERVSCSLVSAVLAYWCDSVCRNLSAHCNVLFKHKALDTVGSYTHPIVRTCALPFDLPRVQTPLHDYTPTFESTLTHHSRLPNAHSLHTKEIIDNAFRHMETNAGVPEDVPVLPPTSNNSLRYTVPQTFTSIIVVLLTHASPK